MLTFILLTLTSFLKKLSGTCSSSNSNSRSRGSVGRSFWRRRFAFLARCAGFGRPRHGTSGSSSSRTWFTMADAWVLFYCKILTHLCSLIGRSCKLLLDKRSYAFGRHNFDVGATQLRCWGDTTPMLARRNFGWGDVTSGNKAMGRHNLTPMEHTLTHSRRACSLILHNCISLQ